MAPGTPLEDIEKALHEEFGDSPPTVEKASQFIVNRLPTMDGGITIAIGIATLALMGWQIYLMHKDQPKKDQQPDGLWLFVYGSLMWDDWAEKLEGTRIDGAALSGYRRSFNKASTERWGTTASPGPTLGLEPDADASCVGTAFQFPERRRAEVLDLLRRREGPSFTFPKLLVTLPGGRQIDAVTPVNDKSKETYIGARPLADRAAMAKAAAGSRGSAVDYAHGILFKLKQMDVRDSDVEAFIAALGG